MDGKPNVDEQVALLPSEGGTVCHVQCWQGASGFALVVVTELPDNPGLSVSLNFGAVAAAVRARMPAGAQDPLWVESWPGRSLASYLLHDVIICAHHLLWQSGGAWWRRPLSAAATRQLLWLVAGEQAALAYSG